MANLITLIKKRYNGLGGSNISSSLSFRETQKWIAFGQNRHNTGAVVRKDLLTFLDEHGSEIKTATELGCGGFVESLYLAQQGIKVTGIDGVINWNLFNSILSNPSISEETKNNLSVQEQNFADLNLEKTDLVCSFCSLPFCPREHFGDMMSRIVNSVNPNGYMLLHFFGKDHPFVQQGQLTGFDREQLESAFVSLGFETSCYEYTSQKTAQGIELPSMTNIVVTAKAPEQMPECSPETMNLLLGLAPTGEEFDEEQSAPFTFQEDTSDEPTSVEDLENSETPSPIENLPPEGANTEKPLPAQQGSQTDILELEPLK